MPHQHCVFKFPTVSNNKLENAKKIKNKKNASSGEVIFVQHKATRWWLRDI
jgi:hypothetical protein